MKSTLLRIRISTFIFFIIITSMITYSFSISESTVANTSNIQITGKQEKISLQDAIAKKLISTKFRGMGAAYGDAITVEVKNKTKFPLTIEVIVGTKLISNDKSKQDMVLGKVKGKIVDDTSYIVKDLIEIQPKSKEKYLLKAYCIDSPKPEPSPSTSLKIAEIDSSIQFIIQQGHVLNCSSSTIQASIWIILESKTDEQLKEKIEINDEELLKAKELNKTIKKL